jgi:hypothetical protein
MPDPQLVYTPNRASQEKPDGWEKWDSIALRPLVRYNGQGSLSNQEPRPQKALPHSQIFFLGEAFPTPEKSHELPKTNDPDE